MALAGRSSLIKRTNIQNSSICIYIKYLQIFHGFSWIFLKSMWGFYPFNHFLLNKINTYKILYVHMCYFLADRFFLMFHSAI